MEGNLQISTLYIPNIHLQFLHLGFREFTQTKSRNIEFSCRFSKKKVQISFHSKNTSLKKIVLLLSAIGYEPSIYLADYENEKKALDRSLIYKLGIAGFAFGNTMFLSFPEYFEVDGFWIEKYKTTFRWLMFFFSVPVVFYAGKDYFITAYKGLAAKILNIDIPIALGILVLFIRSSVEIIFNLGTGFF